MKKLYMKLFQYWDNDLANEFYKQLLKSNHSIVDDRFIIELDFIRGYDVIIENNKCVYIKRKY